MSLKGIQLNNSYGDVSAEQADDIGHQYQAAKIS